MLSIGSADGIMLKSKKQKDAKNINQEKSQSALYILNLETKRPVSAI
jgi:hypothetical protein